jgi:hypothetical protein
MREGSARDADNSELLVHLLPRLSAVLARRGSGHNARAVGRQPELDQAEETWPISRALIGRHPICSQRDNRVLKSAALRPAFSAARVHLSRGRLVTYHGLSAA